MKIETALVAAVQKAVETLYGQQIDEKQVQLQKTKKEFEGHLTLVVFPFVRLARKKPEEVAQEIGEQLQQTDIVASFNVVKGFLNLVIAPKAWIELLADIDAADKYGFVPVTDQSPLMMIEYSSPNTNKPPLGPRAQQPLRLVAGSA